MMRKGAKHTWTAVEHARTETALRASEERMRLLLESVQDYAIFTLNATGRVTSWNEGARRLMGYTGQEIIGQPLHRFYCLEDIVAQKPEYEMQTALRLGRFEDEGWRVHKDDSRLWINEIMTPLLAHDGTLLGFTKVSRDLSERKRVEEELRRLNETLEQRVQERTEQVRQLVTELSLSEQKQRRRISSILHDDLQQRLFSLSIQLAIQRGLLEKQMVDDAEQLIDDMEQDLRALIQEIRSLSVELSPPVLHNEGLVEALHWLAAQMEQQHGLVVTIQTRASWPRLYDDLRVLLFQIVRELLFNVVQHANVREATITLGVEADVLWIEVRDPGDGFELNASDLQAGYGLARSEQRLRLLDGHMQVISQPGEGTQVTLYLPLTSERAQKPD